MLPHTEFKRWEVECATINLCLQRIRQLIARAQVRAEAECRLIAIIGILTNALHDDAREYAGDGRFDEHPLDRHTSEKGVYEL